MDTQAIIALLTLTALEIVLGIDNIIFISILTDKLPKDQQPRARIVGLAAAMVMRVALLFSLTWIMRLVNPLFTVFEHPFSGRDLILIGGGLFLLAKSTHEIHSKLEGDEEGGDGKKTAPSFAGVITQIMLLDIIFSLDSVITAVGMSNQLWVMIAAVIIAVAVMMASSGAISQFVHRHPTIKMLALSFLLLIGFTLIGEGFGMHIPKGYVYFAIAFSVFVEFLNIKMRRKSKPVNLHEKVIDAKGHAVTPR
ncbi:MAG TPA: TerC family protein [Blastocatellia bacterium]|nr:TerC family protein [Blastocatellia bacterium]